MTRTAVRVIHMLSYLWYTLTPVLVASAVWEIAYPSHLVQPGMTGVYKLGYPRSLWDHRLVGVQELGYASQCGTAGHSRCIQS
jgi:hypothetical protein